MRRAFTHLRSGRPGPVLLIIPRDLGEYDEDEHPYTPVKGWRSGPDPDDVKAAVKALLAAKDPLLYVGEGVFYADATAELLQFAELAQVPVLTTLKAKGAFPENHPLSVGVRGSLAEHFLQQVRPALLDRLQPLPRTASATPFPTPSKKTIVQCTVDTLDINRSYETRHAVIGDAKLTLQALIDELSAQTGGVRARSRRCSRRSEARKEAFLAKFRPLMESNETPINPYRVYRRPDEGARPEELVRHRRLRQHARPDQHGVRGADPARLPRLGQRLHARLQPGRRGRRPSSRIPNRQCVNVTGDAGVCYMMGNFEAVARYKIGITTIHINNGGYSGYGPGFWGEGHDPYTWKVSDHAKACMASMARARRLPRRGRDRAVGDHPGAEARA